MLSHYPVKLPAPNESVLDAIKVFAEGLEKFGKVQESFGQVIARFGEGKDELARVRKLLYVLLVGVGAIIAEVGVLILRFDFAHRP